MKAAVCAAIALGATNVAATTGSCTPVESESFMYFSELPFPYTTKMKQGMLASPVYVEDGVAMGTGGYNVVLRSGDKVNAENWPFGAVMNLHYDTQVYKLVEDESTITGYATDMTAVDTSGNPDFTSYIKVDGSDYVWSYVQFESPTPCQMYQVKLAQGPECGLHAVDVMPVDFSAVGGLWVPCAGSVSPWGTHLGSEEYEPDAKLFSYSLEDYIGYDDGSFGDLVAFMRYWGVYPEDITSMADITEYFYPYKYGYVTEISNTADGTMSVGKHYAMGRRSTELAKVLPDQRTVYITDDGTNTMMSMFYADVEGDLSAGTLYVANFHQVSADDGGNFTVTWVNLGHAAASDIEPYLETTTFADIFDEAEPSDSEPYCPNGYTSINAGQSMGKHECLKLKDGMDKLASRLETRRYAAMMGATTEFSKMEGITYDESRGMIYVAMSAVRAGMENFAYKGEEDNSTDVGGYNHIRVAYNGCGCVYQLPYAESEKYGGALAATQMYGLLCGNMVWGTDDLNECDVNSIASPDNLAYIPEYDYLLIGEDTDGHQNDAVWAYFVPNGALTRIVTSPYGAETTGAYWYPDVGGCRYISVQGQHPYGETDEEMVSACGSEGAAGYVGYMKLGSVAAAM